MPHGRERGFGFVESLNDLGEEALLSECAGDLLDG
jgi:hypothetical protein